MLVKIKSYNLSLRGTDALIQKPKSEYIYINSEKIICLDICLEETPKIKELYPQINFPMYRLTVEGLASNVYTDASGFQEILECFNGNSKKLLKENI